MEFIPQVQTCVRVNPHNLVGVDAGSEEQQVISSINRPISHAVFSSNIIRILGPLGAHEGGIPLREYLVGPGERQGDLTARFDQAPNPVSTTYYAHYAGDILTGKQYETLWQFERFANRESVINFDPSITQEILTLNYTVDPPSTIYDQVTRRYEYEGWTERHFNAFFEKYCTLRGGDILMWQMHDSEDGMEWMTMVPPRPLTKDELGQYEADIARRQQGVEAPESRVDMELDDLVLLGEVTKSKPCMDAAVAVLKETAKPKKWKKLRQLKIYKKGASQAAPSQGKRRFKRKSRVKKSIPPNQSLFLRASKPVTVTPRKPKLHSVRAGNRKCAGRQKMGRQNELAKRRSKRYA